MGQLLYFYLRLRAPKHTTAKLEDKIRGEWREEIKSLTTARARSAAEYAI